MAASNAANIWTQMNYVPPRGQCNFKQSIVSSKCPCLRFMLHPLKSSASYECDGCSHHASFHSMENPAEDEVRKRWEQEARENAEQGHQEQALVRPRKRPRAIEYHHDAAGVTAAKDRMTISDNVDTVSKTGSNRANTKAVGKRQAGDARSLASTRAARTRGKIAESLENDEEYVELD